MATIFHWKPPRKLLVDTNPHLNDVHQTVPCSNSDPCGMHRMHVPSQRSPGNVASWISSHEWLLWASVHLSDRGRLPALESTSSSGDWHVLHHVLHALLPRCHEDLDWMASEWRLCTDRNRVPEGVIQRTMCCCSPSRLLRRFSLVLLAQFRPQLPPSFETLIHKRTEMFTPQSLLLAAGVTTLIFLVPGSNGSSLARMPMRPKSDEH